MQAAPAVGFAAGQFMLLPPMHCHFELLPQKQVPIPVYGHWPCAGVHMSPTVGLVAGQTMVFWQAQLPLP